VELEAGDVEFVRFSDRGGGSADGFQAKYCFLRRKESSDRGTHSVLPYSTQKPLGLLFRFSTYFFTKNDERETVDANFRHSSERSDFCGLMLRRA
jgi:hypothetical protein